MSKMTEDVLYKLIISLLKERKYTRAQLTEKLRFLTEDLALIDHILDQYYVSVMKELDKKRCAEIIEKQINKGYGPLRIYSFLEQKGFPNDVIVESLEAITICWKKQAKKVRSQKFGEDWPQKQKECLQQKRFLELRGFDKEAVSQLFEGKIKNFIE